MKKMLFIVGTAVVIGSLWWSVSRDGQKGDTDAKDLVVTATTTPLVSTSTPVLKNSTSTPIAKKVKTAAELEAEMAWRVFDTFLKAVKDHDIETVKRVSHQVSEQCTDPTREKECFMLMDNVHILGSAIKKEDFTIVWSDAKQLILSTPFKRYADDKVAGYGQGVMYFTKVGGEHKILSYNPGRAAALALEGTSGDDATLEKKLQEMIKDSDKDGLSDQFETCAGDYANIAGCKETNPQKRDTDGDGWWDGIERFFYVKN
ncbi:MAG TPA: hypothetical protein VJH55_01310 [Candidatus Paceibacterota bacterium]